MSQLKAKNSPNATTGNSHKLNATALAIGASLGMTGTADAEVVYVDVDPDLSASSWGDGTKSFTLDVDGNGTTDFSFSHYFRPQGYCGYGCYITHFGDSDVTSFGSNGVIGSPQADGSAIDGGDNFAGGKQQLFDVYYYSSWGPWKGTSLGYLGFKFDIDGANHYGWAQLSVSQYNGAVSLRDYAYNTTAGAGVFAGSKVPLPAAAPLLGAALGSLGVTAFRRRKRKFKEDAKNQDAAAA